jgi:hypothetical protein
MNRKWPAYNARWRRKCRYHGIDIECVRERVQKGARTFMVKVKAHRGEPLNGLADTLAENARQLSDECRQWTVRTPSMTYEWSDNNGLK